MEIITLDKIKELFSEKRFDAIKKSINELNEVDIAELFEGLSQEEQLVIFKLLDKDLSADVFSEMDPEAQENLVEVLSDKELSSVINDMYLDDAVDLVSELPANLVSKLLKNANPEVRQQINHYLAYSEDSVGSIMTNEFVDLKADMTVEKAFAKIRSSAVDKETVYTCYVTDNSRKLIGVVTVRELLMASYETVVNDIMETNVKYVTTADSREKAAMDIRKYGFLALPVVDSEMRIVGIITVDDAIDVLTEESTEDIAKMAAIMPSEKPYLKQNVFEIWLKRIPWLLLLMVSGTFTGKIISSFESALAVVPVLTAFIPMIMDTGGNAGGQASVTVIRGLALEQIRLRDTLSVIWKEIRVAVMAGAALAAINFGKILLVDNLLLGSNVSLIVAAVICITLMLTVCIAKIIGCSLPIIAKSLKLDPAVMASPFITTIVDALSLLMYFGIATLILGL